MRDLPVISLFSGVGGLDVAAHKAGPLRVAVGVEWENDEVETLKANFDVPVLQDDIRRTTTKEMMRAAGLRKSEATLVVGGPPCTPFSKSGFWLDYKKESRDPNASLLDEYARVVEEARPEAFLLENVYGLTYKTHAKQLARFLQRLDAAGYRRTGSSDGSHGATGARRDAGTCSCCPSSRGRSPTSTARSASSTSTRAS